MSALFVSSPRRRGAWLQRLCPRFRQRTLGSVCLSLFLAASGAQAQWVTEQINLSAGWRAVWLPIDCTHETIDNLLAGQPSIEEVWRWNPNASAGQFTQSPVQPSQTDAQWHLWRRGFPIDTTLGRLTGNAAYLVKVAEGTAPFTLQLTGRPLPPKIAWKSSGLNFVGFPIEEPDSLGLRSFERFFSFSPVLKTGPATFAYPGGPLLAGTNPARVTAPRLRAVSRHQAYWVETNAYTDYTGPLQLTLADSDGIDFSEQLVTRSLRVRNVTNQEITATFTPLDSAAPPSGQPTLAGAVPLKVRGDFDPATTQFTYTDVTGPFTRTIAAGEETEIVLVANRSAMGNTAGAEFGSILRLTDSLNLTRIDLPVHAVTTSLAGLWVGSAVVTQVEQFVGQTKTLVPAPSNFPLRLIVHMDASGNTRLLQQLFAGDTATAKALATSEDAPGFTAARRISASHLPPRDSANTIGTGRLALSGTAAFVVNLGYDEATNPFVHTYHPDHDNLDAKFPPTLLPEGKESYNVSRAITLTFQASVPGFSDPTWGSSTLGGDYSEVVTGLRADVPSSPGIRVTGAFVLRRVSDVTTLLTR